LTEIILSEYKSVILAISAFEVQYQRSVSNKYISLTEGN